MENMDKGHIVRKYPKCPKIYLPKLSAQAQKFGILMKKGFIPFPLFMIKIKPAGIIEYYFRIDLNLF